MSNVSEHHILRLGGFNSLYCFSACIGKPWDEGHFEVNSRIWNIKIFMA